MTVSAGELQVAWDTGNNDSGTNCDAYGETHSHADCDADRNTYFIA